MRHGPHCHTHRCTQSVPNKDMTLHVSATNAAMVLYQQFGFRTEEFVLDFYDRYLPDDSPMCKHAFLMRLRQT
jgi:cysteine-rich protein 2-binding protein